MAEPLTGGPAPDPARGYDPARPAEANPRTQPLRVQSEAEEFVRDPVGALREPENRHKLLLATAVLTLLNTLLLAITLGSVAGDGADPITVNGRPCVVMETDEGNTLFCQP